jgi:hypothetical protein
MRLQCTFIFHLSPTQTFLRTSDQHCVTANLVCLTYFFWDHYDPMDVAKAEQKEVYIKCTVT